MLEVMKKRVARNLIWRIIIAAVVIGGILIYCGQSLLLFIQGPKPISAGMDYDAAKDSYLSFDAAYVIDEYVRQSERNTDTNKETLKNISYFVYFKEDGYFFGIELPSSKEEEMEQYMDDTYRWLDGEIEEVPGSKHVAGTWTELTGKRLQYYKEQITDDLGEEFLEIALPYYLDTNAVGNRSLVSLYVCLAGMAIAFLTILWNLVRYCTGSTQKKIKKYLDGNQSVSMEQIEADFAAAQAISGTIWVGRRWTYHVAGLTAGILENRSLVWGYYYRRTGRYSESTLRLYDINRKMHGLTASEKEAMAALDVYERQQPQMVLGYKKELEKMYQKDYQNFLNLRYNRPADDFSSFEPENADPWNEKTPTE